MTRQGVFSGVMENIFKGFKAVVSHFGGSQLKLAVLKIQI